MDELKFYHSLKAKLIVLFSLLIITPFVFSGSVFYSSYINKLEENSMNYSRQLTFQIGTSFDTYLNDVYRLLLFFYSDQYILQVMNLHGDEKRNDYLISSMESNRISAALSTLAYDRSEIAGISVFCKDGAIYSNTVNNGIYDKEITDYWGRYLLQIDDSIVIVPPQDTEYYSGEQNKVFSVLRPVRNSYTGEWTGLIKVDIGAEVFNKIFSSPEIVPENSIVITDANNNIFYPVSLQGTIFEEADTGKSTDSQSLKSIFISPQTGIKVIGLFRKNELNQDGRILIGKIFIISLVSLVVALIVAVLVSNSLVRPIRHLMDKMDRVRSGETWEKADIETKDELGLLAINYNSMIDRIQELIQEVRNLVKEVYEVKIRERNAELSALQSQINPHFLYNTLEILSMTALENGQIEICEISASLGRLLRYTVEKQQKPVFLSDELRFVEAYFKILSLRFGQRVNTSIHAEKALMMCLVPKLIIQPLLENAVKHGIGEDVGAIDVVVEKEEETLVIKVIDNGCGINPVKLEELKSRIYRENVDDLEKESFGQIRSGYALRNVHKRLSLLYGQKYGLQVESDEKIGSAFILRLPFNTGEMNPGRICG